MDLKKKIENFTFMIKIEDTIARIEKSYFFATEARRSATRKLDRKIIFSYLNQDIKIPKKTKIKNFFRVGVKCA